jgi:hypothetical protein
MCPDIDESAAGLNADALRAEGADFARALLDRIAAGASSAEDLAGTLLFLGAGQMLHGAAAVLVAALRLASVSPSATLAAPEVRTPAHGGPSNAR